MRKILISILVIWALFLSVADSFAFSTDELKKCFKLVSGYDYVEAVLNQAAGVLNVAIAHPECHAQLMSEDPLFYSMMGTAIALKVGTSINSKEACQNLPNGMVDQAIGTVFAQNVADLTPEQKIQLQSAAGSQAKNSLSSIPGMQYWNCACEYAYSDLIVSEVKNIVRKESNALNSCGSITGINSILSGVAEGIGLKCPSGERKMHESLYLEKMLKPNLRTYALMNNEERESQCMRRTSGQWLGCFYYYNGGSKACRMEKGNAEQLCDKIMNNFRDMVSNYQPSIVTDEIASCSKVGDGCEKDKFEPLVINAYGYKATFDCIVHGIKTLPNCKPKEQPCCQNKPATGRSKCDKAVGKAALHTEPSLRVGVQKGFVKLDETNADAQMKAELESCRAGIIKGLLASMKYFACAAATALPESTEDISGIWPGVYKQAKDQALVDDQKKCVFPFEKKKHNKICADKCTPETAQALYGSKSYTQKCISDCLSGTLSEKKPQVGGGTKHYLE